MATLPSFHRADGGNFYLLSRDLFGLGEREREMLFALAGHPIPLSLERRVDKAMDGWMALGRMGRHRSTLLARSLVRSAVHKSLILTVPLPTLSTAPSTKHGRGRPPMPNLSAGL